MATENELRIEAMEEDLANIQKLLENIANQTQIQQLQAVHQADVDNLTTRIEDLETDVATLMDEHTP